VGLQIKRVDEPAGGVIMAVIADVTWTVATPEEFLTTSNAGWATSDRAPQGSGVIRVTNSGGVNSAYNRSTTETFAYLRTETPANKNQTVTLRIRNRSDLGATAFWHAIARYTNSGEYDSNWIGLSITGGSGRSMQIVKCVGGTRSNVGAASTDAARMATVGTEGDLTLVVSGDAPTISVEAKWDGVTVLGPFTVTDAALNAVGQVGFLQRTFADDTETTGFHVTRFTGSDADGSPPAGTVTISSVTPSTTTAVVAYSYSETDETGFEYRLGTGVAQAIGASPATITGLAESTAYTVQVRAINGNGVGAWSTVANFTTTDSPGFDFDTLAGCVFGSIVGSLTGISLAAEVDVLVRAYNTTTGALVVASGTLTTNATTGRLPRWQNAALNIGTSYHLVFVRVSDGAIACKTLTAT